MTGILSIAKKRLSILTIKASVFFLLILCTFIFSQNVLASTIVYTSPNGSTMDIDGVVVPSGGDSSIYYAFVGAGSSGTSIPFYYGTLWATFQNTEPTSFSTSTYETGTFCFTSTGCSPSIPWEIDPLDQKILSINGVSTGAINNMTHIDLISPLNLSTSTSPIDLGVSYYINVASSTTAWPNEIVYTINSQTAGVFGQKTYVKTVTDVYPQTIDYDTLTNDTQTFALPDGIYSWSAALVATSTKTSDCGTDVFCALWGSGSSFTTSTTTYAKSETWQFAVGYYQFTASSSTSTPPTNGLLSFCSTYDNSNIVVTALCFIPNTISDTVDAIFKPDNAAVAADLAEIKGDIFGLQNTIPIGYATRLYNIFTATTTATNTIPSFTASILYGAGSQAPSTTTITIDPADMLAGGGTLLASIRDPIDNKSAQDVFAPYIQLSLALGVIFTIAADVMGSHKHHAAENKTKLS